ncbi:MAG: TonB-dependent receptor [Paludibacteraceae bacterium]|nr:TonB-dependent receptor [Paludibacteraceae bacterium]
MNRYKHILLMMLMLPAALAAQDTILNRNVTVERDFQPIISSAGIVSVKPVIVQQDFEPVEVTYSTYSQSLAPAFNINPLGCSLTTWNQPKPLHGYVSGGLGHTNTAFDFGYRIEDNKSKIALDAYAHHRAAWGRYTVERTTFGLDITKSFRAAALYFGADAENQYYTMSGRYVDSTGMIHISKPSQLKAEDKLALWAINTRIGIRSIGRGSVSYRLQTGYSAFMHGTNVTEHQIRTIGNLQWSGGEHRAGVNLRVSDFFMNVNDNTIPDSLYNARHAIRIEPFYAYDHNRFHAHIGVNLDMNIGRGQLMSGNKDITFAPSPNVRIEYDITRNWLAIYGEASGSLGEGSMQGYSNLYPYRHYRPGVVSHHVAAYIPVQAQLGLKIRPQANLLIDLHARYELKKNQFSTCNPYYWEARQFRDALGATDDPVYGEYVYSHLQRWKIGAEITWHYQDIVHVLIAGGYYTGSMDSIEVPSASKGKAAEIASFEAAVKNPDGTYKMLDRPRWDLRVNIDARINRHWTLYSHNYFTGARQALMFKQVIDPSAYTTDPAAHTREYSIGKHIPTIELNLGCTYEYNKWLSVFLELNNILHRHNVYYYGYTNPGINFLLGASYKF